MNRSAVRSVVLHASRVAAPRGERPDQGSGDPASAQFFGHKGVIQADRGLALLRIGQVSALPSTCASNRRWLASCFTSSCVPSLLSIVLPIYGPRLQCRPARSVDSFFAIS
jgi:hypothetical protein